MSVLNLTTDIVGKTIAATDHGITNGIEWIRLTATDGTIYELRPVVVLTRAGAKLLDEERLVASVELQATKRRPCSWR